MHTTFTIYHTLSIVSFLLLLLIVFRFTKIIYLTKKITAQSVVISLIILMLSLFYKEQRTSGMGLLTTYGFPKAFIEFWKDFTNTESYKSFKILYFCENWSLYFLFVLIIIGLKKKTAISHQKTLLLTQVTVAQLLFFRKQFSKT